MPDEDFFEEIPLCLTPPELVEADIEYQFDFWKGDTTLRCNGVETPGKARVFLDLMPAPKFLFEFTPDIEPSVKDMFDGVSFGDSILDCGTPIGPVECYVTNSGSQYTGFIRKQTSLEAESKLCDAATFLVLNGPYVHGKPIRNGLSSYTGRMCTTIDGAEITIDRLSSKKQPRRDIYKVTHVVSCKFPEPVFFQYN